MAAAAVLATAAVPTVVIRNLAISKPVAPADGVTVRASTKVWIDHNSFSNVSSRIPSLRFGTGHFYDDYVVGAETAAHSRMGAQMLVENDVFRSTKAAVTTNRDSDEDGYANLTGNDLGGAATEVSQVGTFAKPPYRYTAEPASSVVASVTSGAGAGKL